MVQFPVGSSVTAVAIFPESLLVVVMVDAATGLRLALAETGGRLALAATGLAGTGGFDGRVMRGIASGGSDGRPMRASGGSDGRGARGSGGSDGRATRATGGSEGRAARAPLPVSSGVAAVGGVGGVCASPAVLPSITPLEADTSPEGGGSLGRGVRGNAAGIAATFTVLLTAAAAGRN